MADDDSILTSIKHVLHIGPDDDAFDLDIIMYINSVFSTLEELGVGPDGGFMITDSTPVWNDYLSNDYRLNNVKTYMFLRVKMLFDPPSTGYHTTAMENQIKEHEWRLAEKAGGGSWDSSESPTNTGLPEVVL